MTYPVANIRPRRSRSRIVYGGPSQNPELVPNGQFTNNIDGWMNTSTAPGTIAWNAAGYLDLIAGAGAGQFSRTQTNVPTVVGEEYRLIVVSAAGATISIFDGPNTVLGTVTAGQTLDITFTATTSPTVLGLRNFQLGQTGSIDTVSVRLNT